MEHGYDVMIQGNTYYIYEKPPNRRLIEKVDKTKNKMFPLTHRSWNISTGPMFWSNQALREHSDNTSFLLYHTLISVQNLISL